jgi:hypothetical protein
LANSLKLLTAISHVLPINEIDEKMTLKLKFENMAASYTEEEEKTAAYLNRLTRNITFDSKKPFILGLHCPRQCQSFWLCNQYIW